MYKRKADLRKHLTGGLHRLSFEEADRIAREAGMELKDNTNFVDPTPYRLHMDLLTRITPHQHEQQVELIRKQTDGQREGTNIQDTQGVERRGDTAIRTRGPADVAPFPWRDHPSDKAKERYQLPYPLPTVQKELEELMKESDAQINHFNIMGGHYKSLWAWRSRNHHDTCQFQK